MNTDSGFPAAFLSHRKFRLPDVGSFPVRYAAELCTITEPDSSASDFISGLLPGLMEL